MDLIKKEGETMAFQRPSEYRRLTRVAMGLAQEPMLDCEIVGDDAVAVYYLESAAMGPPPGPEARCRLMVVEPDLLTIYPINTNPAKDDYLQSKYGQLRTIEVTRPSNRLYELPDNSDDVEELLQGLPAGFAKDFRSGLGLLWEYRFICEAIASIPGVTTLVIHGQGGSQDSKIDGGRYVLGISRFNALRKDLVQIATRYQREARSDRRLIAYDRLLHAADRQAYPAKKKVLRADAISDIAYVGTRAAKLSKRDQRAVLKLVDENAADIVKNEPRALLRLKEDIERVTLKELIEKFEAMLLKNLGESKWQSFLQTNPFILSLAFAVPAMLIDGNSYVGGARVNRRGGKITDFLLATASTGSLSLVEIKKPTTQLLVTYRDDVFGPSAELGGSISQLLDQRAQLNSEWQSLVVKSDLRDKHGYSILGVLVIGTTPGEVHRRKSLDLIRNSLVGVVVVTFDELLGRLKEIHAALSPESIDDSDDVPF